MADWAYAFASRQGSAPGKTGCQDYALVEDIPMKSGQSALLAIVSDGAGSARCSAEGAELASKALARKLSTILKDRKSLRGLSGGIAKDIFLHVNQLLQLHAETQGIEVSEFSCTLVVALTTHDECVFFQLGDGAIVVSRGGAYQAVFWPDHGEFVNETVFVTDVLHLNRLMVRRLKGPIDSFAVFSDGIQYLVLDFKTKQPHAKFFDSMSKALSHQPAGNSEIVSKWLDQEVLASPNVSSRTDDDVTLVIAANRGGNRG